MAAFKYSPSDPLPTTEIHGSIINPADYPPMPGTDSKASIDPQISYGLPFPAAIRKHVPESASVYVIASKTLAANTSHLQRLKDVLGKQLVGVQVGMTPHTLYSEVQQIIKSIRSLSNTDSIAVDTIITLGAGSISDASKFVALALETDIPVETLDDLERVSRSPSGSVAAVEADRIPNSKKIRLIMIPTSLSAGEHTPISGVTADTTHRKHLVPAKQSNLTILDPDLCLSTPLDIWLQSGVRGIDHAVEAMCSLLSTDEIFTVGGQALRLLVPGLLNAKRNVDDSPDGKATDVRARLEAQLGVALAIIPLIWRVPCGASHGIGHQLGPLGVGHGETSCILLPAVCGYNRSVNADRQDRVARMLWDLPVCRELFGRKGLQEKKEEGGGGRGADLADLLDVVIRALGMPRSLREKGIGGQETLEKLAKNSLTDVLVRTNPRPIDRPEQVLEILEMVKG